MASNRGVIPGIDRDRELYDALGRGVMTGAPERPLPQALTVTDLCELAKAGVKLEAADVHKLLTADAVYNPPVVQKNAFSMSLEERVYHRWQSMQIEAVEGFESQRQFRNRSGRDFDTPPFKIGKVITHVDKQYVFVHKEGNPPLIIEDECALFPSDTLMNSLRLMDKALPDAPSTQTGVASVGSGAGASTPRTGNGAPNAGLPRR